MDFIVTLEKRFISHYMLTETLHSEKHYCRWLAEDMRSNRTVWITEFFERNGNATDDKWLNIASQIKKISLPCIIQVSDFFREGDSGFVVSEIPKGKMLKPLERYDEDRFRKIGEGLLRALVLLQRNEIGLDDLSLKDIFVDDGGEIKLFFSDNWSLKPENESREKEIALFAIVLLNFLGFENKEKVEITQEFLKRFVPETIYPLFEEILIGRQVQRFEALSRYFQDKMKVSLDSGMDTNESDRPSSNKFLRYLLLASIVLIIYMLFSPKTDLSQSISRFDVLRFHMLGSIGMSEPQRILGELYEKGNGVDRDMKESIEWYRKAAQSGNVYAQMSLGHFYYKGIGVPCDRKQALYWFTLAATNGDELAKRNVEMIQENEKRLELPVHEVKDELKKVSSPLLENNVSKDTVLKVDPTLKIEPVNITTEPIREEKKSIQNMIMWQDNQDTVTLKLTWNEAMNYCLDLKLDGYDDWRLPDKETLFQLFFEEQDLKYHVEDLYWSSTQNTDLTAWRVYFNYVGGKNRLSLTSNSKNDRWNVRCYRKIQ